jgi:amidohydrolase
MSLLARIQALAAEHHSEWVGIRRHLHAHPELSFEEHQTMDYVSSVLTSWGVEHQTQVTGTGIVAHVHGQQPDSRTVALRADMDALPITEANEVDYASTNPGVMHACGHDVHTTSLLGALRILQLTSDGWQGTVRCIFQPGEETIPGGAKDMVAAGVLTNPEPAGIFGQHVFPDLPAGHVGVRGGAYMASADEIHLTVKGKGGHAALPHKCRDAVLAASNVVVAAQQLVARLCPPGQPSVLSFGFMEALGSTNVLPNQVRLKGTFRAMDEGWRHEAHKALTALIQSTCQAHGCEADLDIRKGYPAVNNHVGMAAAFKAVACEYLGTAHVHDLDIRMTGEDFSYFANEIPGCFYRLGTASPEPGNALGTHGLHTPRFDVDEEALKVGTGLMAYAAATAAW